MISLLAHSGNYQVWEDDVLIYSDAMVLSMAPKAACPELPAEVWNSRPINGDDCMAAVHAMCEGART